MEHRKLQILVNQSRLWADSQKFKAVALIWGSQLWHINLFLLNKLLIRFILSKSVSTRTLKINVHNSAKHQRLSQILIRWMQWWTIFLDQSLFKNTLSLLLRFYMLLPLTLIQNLPLQTTLITSLLFRVREKHPANLVKDELRHQVAQKARLIHNLLQHLLFKEGISFILQVFQDWKLQSLRHAQDKLPREVSPGINLFNLILLWPVLSLTVSL